MTDYEQAAIFKPSFWIFFRTSRVEQGDLIFVLETIFALFFFYEIASTLHVVSVILNVLKIFPVLPSALVSTDSLAVQSLMKTKTKLYFII